MLQEIGANSGLDPKTQRDEIEDAIGLSSCLILTVSENGYASEPTSTPTASSRAAARASST